MENRLSGHSVYRTEYHVVWIPKYRRRVLNADVKEYLKKLWPKDIERNSGSRDNRGKYAGGPYTRGNDHPTEVFGKRCIGRLKGQSASNLRKKFPWLAKVYWKENIVWSPGYFVSTIGLNEEQIIKYVKWQESQDSGQAKLEL